MFPVAIFIASAILPGVTQEHKNEAIAHFFLKNLFCHTCTLEIGLFHKPEQIRSRRLAVDKAWIFRLSMAHAFQTIVPGT